MNYRDDFYSKTIQIYLLIYFSRMQAKKKKICRLYSVYMTLHLTSTLKLKVSLSNFILNLV